MFGDKTLYEYREDGELRHFTYRDNLEHMNWLGTAFAELGLMGGRVAVIGDTHPHYMTAYFATVNGGGVIIPLDRDLPDTDIADFLNFSEASALVYTESFAKAGAKYPQTCTRRQVLYPDKRRKQRRRRDIPAWLAARDGQKAA
jgi:long-subunit acyl-CoA synthetase (AMP-forming)